MLCRAPAGLWLSFHRRRRFATWRPSNRQKVFYLGGRTCWKHTWKTAGVESWQILEVCGEWLPFSSGLCPQKTIVLMLKIPSRTMPTRRLGARVCVCVLWLLWFSVGHDSIRASRSTSLGAPAVLEVGHVGPEHSLAQSLGLLQANPFVARGGDPAPFARAPSCCYYGRVPCNKAASGAGLRLITGGGSPC